MVAAAAVVVSLTGLLLWLSMLLGPWRLVSGLIDAHSHLESAQKALESGKTKDARYEALAGRAAVKRANAGLTSGGPLWDLVRVVPQVNDALGEAPHLVKAERFSANAAKGTLRIVQNALKGPARIILKKNGESRIRIHRIEQIGKTLHKVHGAVSSVERQLGYIDLGKLPNRAGPAIRSGIKQAQDTQKVLADAEAGFKILPGVLGANGKRRYLIGALNSDELRGTGGALLQFKLLTIDNGSPHLQRKGGTVYNVDKNRRIITGVPLPGGAWYQQGIDDARRFGNANWSPDWPLAARLTLAYGRASSPAFPKVDGVMAVDPVAIEKLIPAAGHFRSSRANANMKKDTVLPYLLYRAYQKFPKPQIRRAVLSDIVGGFYQNLFNPAHASALPKAMGSALAQKHVQIWMRKPSEERYMKRMKWGGAIGKERGADYLNVVEQNVGGNKLNYFESMTDSMHVKFSGRDARVRTTVNVHNGVELPQPRWFLGDQRLTGLHKPMLNVYVPANARLGSASHVGTLLPEPAPAIWSGGLPPEHMEKGKKVWSATLGIPPGKDASATFDYSVPGAVHTSGSRSVYKLVLQHQPKLRTETRSVTITLPSGASGVAAPGFKRSGDTLTWEKPMKYDTELTVAWRR